MKNSIGVRLTVLTLIVGLCFISNCSILQPKKMITPEIKALELKESGANAVEAAQVLTSIFGLNKARDLAQILKDAGFNAIQIADMLEKKFNMELSALEGVLEAIGCTSDEIFGVTSLRLAIKFAPQLRFDQAAHNFPMSAQEYYDNVIATELWKKSPVKDWNVLKESIKDEDLQFLMALSYVNRLHYAQAQMDNRDSNTIINNEVPTYYKPLKCGNQVRIVYWWFYGYQFECIDLGLAKFGHHNGDWERVMVTLSEDQTRVVAVTFWQHKGRYTRLALDKDWEACANWKDCGLEIFNGIHPVVYVGKNQHGSYHDKGGMGGCGYFEDFRNSANSELRLNTWMKLINIDYPPAEEESWIQADKEGDFKWGWDGVGTHPTSQRNEGYSCKEVACEGRSDGGWSPLETNGCHHSQCKLTDRYAWPLCYHCPSGYVDWGLTCVEKCRWYPFCDSVGISTYDLDYIIPTSDAGLTRSYN